MLYKLYIYPLNIPLNLPITEKVLHLYIFKLKTCTFRHLSHTLKCLNVIVLGRIYTVGLNA